MMKNKLAAAVLSMLMLTGCGSSAYGSGANDRPRDDLTAREILSEYKGEHLDGLICKGDEEFDNNVEKFYGISIDSIEDGGILYSTDGGYADEITILSFYSNVDGGALLQKRLEERTKLFEDYNPDEKLKLKYAKITAAGKYSVLIIAENSWDIERKLQDKLY